MHKCFHIIVKGNVGSVLVLNKKIKVCLGWDPSPPTCHVVSCERLRDEGLHAFLGMVGYCMHEEH
jgi:hypothetical protein